MSTSMMAATFLAAGAPTSAAELDNKEVNPEVLAQVQNHGQEVSELAKSLPGSPEKGKLISELAKNKSFKTNDKDDQTEEGTTDEGTTDEGTTDEGTAETPANGSEEGTTDEGTVETPADGSEEGPTDEGAT
ncbi:hypothetical protein, partial [Metabacillus fastidiosus]